MDVSGLSHAVRVPSANATDRNVAITMVDYYCDITDHLSRLKKILVDEDYTGKNFSNAVNTLSGTDVEIVQRNKLHTFAVLPKRWIVERSFA